MEIFFVFPWRELFFVVGKICCQERVVVERVVELFSEIK